jgi:hypothetical protein
MAAKKAAKETKAMTPAVTTKAPKAKGGAAAKGKGKGKPC